MVQQHDSDENLLPPMKRRERRGRQATRRSGSLIGVMRELGSRKSRVRALASYEDPDTKSTLLTEILSLPFTLMAMQLPYSSSSFVSNDFTYDVFISFRGTDTQFGFTGNLYKALSDKGINTFIDDKELKKGDEITPSLLKSIEESRIAIIVFSKEYASSLFCLDELVHIIHCSNEKGSKVIPVFYGTEPSHVRKLNDSYGEALAKHEDQFQNSKENMEWLLKWKKALNQAANLSGHHFNLGNEYERDFIEKIVTDVSYKINHVPLHVADYLVGLKSRISEVNSLLDLGSTDGVCIIGILGTEGMGKTKLAQAIYNLISNQFECLCFLHNVRENSVKHGLEYLQEQILSKSIGFETKFGHVLIGQAGWLGRGSRVIITTRDKQLLSSHGIKFFYEAYGLNKEQALELLRTKAFKSKKNDSSYDYILNRAVKYASGLPLALEVVGSNLFGKSIAECESLLDKYDRIPHEDIQKILKVSYDALDEEQQSVFLDIACFFKERRKEFVQEVLHDHYGYCIKSHIGVLVDKSLIKISFYGGVTLHDLIEDMGIEIVRQESRNKPGERSRLWCHDDIVHESQEFYSDSIVISNVDHVLLNQSNLSDECLPILLKWCANVKLLYLSGNNFKILPECLSVCHLLRILNLDECKALEEIRGIPPNLNYLSAMECDSLSSSSRRRLLSQKLHEAGCTDIRFPTRTEEIPDWFEHQSRGHGTISFWFRKKIPSITSILLCPGTGQISEVDLFVNGDECYDSNYLWCGSNFMASPDSEHAFLFDLKLEEQIDLQYEVDLAEWTHVELKLTIEDDYSDTEENDISEDEKINILRSAPMGIHVLKEKSNTEEDVIFTNPYNRKRKLDEYLNASLSQFESPLKKQRLVGVGVLEIEIFQQQHLEALLSGMRNMVLTETK
ncbi:NB-ARC domain protein [Medicago truncatula]|uniref:NB-ARC domain protein n=1 Tax=Medicago truncatula TaxID=3880 RepID=A0A072UBC7_MEDTR|nr:NB-ARC domain protein [Medicago truncatula]